MKQYIKQMVISLLLIPMLSFSQTNKNYITIGYGSICCGCPSGKPIMDFVKKFERDNKLRPFEIYIETNLGKEGEYNFYIGTDNLNSKLLKPFWDKLISVANKQNSQRSENRDGYVNVSNTLITNKNLKNNPKTTSGSLKIYDYKKKTTY